jgi:photosystem II stability/assembly factor-like uncharacterized protein
MVPWGAAIVQIRSILVTVLFLAQLLLLPAAAGAGIIGSTWEPIGPDPINGFFNGGVVGRATAIAVNPSNGNQIWLGTASGGVWYSGDGGYNWHPLSDGEIAPAIGALALTSCDFTGCGFVVAGTGENAIRRDTYYGRGLLVGARTSLGPPPVYTWTVRDGTPTYNFSLGTINDVQIATGAEAAIYITLTSGVTTSSAQTTVTAPEPDPGGYGIYKSTDGGVTWGKLTVPGTAGIRPTDLKLVPGTSTLYAGFMGVGAFKTIDGGNTWCPLTTGITVPTGCPLPSGMPTPFTPEFDWVEIAVWSTNPDDLYVTTGHCPERLIENCMPSLYKSGNGGTTWTRTFTGTDIPGASPWLGPWGYSRYTHALAIHPDALHTVYLGAIRLWRTQNSGNSFTQDDKSLAWGNSVVGARIHDDHREVVFDPLDSGRVYQVNDGGFAARDQINTAWRPGNAGLQITGFQSITASPLTPRVIGGTQDNNAVIWNGSKAWDIMPCCGDAGFTVIDAVNPQHLYALGNFGEVMRSCEGPKDWHLARSFLPTKEEEPRAFYAPMVQDPNPPHHLYWGAQKLYEGEPVEPCGPWTVNWSPVSPALQTGPQDEVYGGEDVITAIAVAPSNSSRIYVGYYGGGLYSTDAACADGSCWIDIGAGLPDSPISRIAVHPTLQDTLFVTLSGWQLDPFETGTRVWVSGDGGANWSVAGNGVPVGIPANTIHYEPGSTTTLWLGIDANPTGASVYRSLDGGATWHAKSNGLPNVPVFDIALDPSRNRAFAGTHGRGAWIFGGGQVLKKELWKASVLLELPFSGLLLPPDEGCSVEIMLGDGTACATGDTDAFGAELRTDSRGRLVSTREGFYQDRELAWACHDGICVGDTPAAACSAPEDPARRLAVTCGSETVEVDLAGPLAITRPPAVQLAVNLSDDAAVAQDGGAGGAQAATTAPLVNEAGSVLGAENGAMGAPLANEIGPVPGVENGAAGTPFDLGLALRTADGTSRSLCTVRGEIFPDETNDPIVTRLRDAINGSAACTAEAVSARLQGLDTTEGGEDLFPRHLTLAVEAPTASGLQIVPSLSAFGPPQPAGGAAVESCFHLLGLGVPIYDQLQPVSVTFVTGPDGASGGQVRQFHQSELGGTGVRFDTTFGMAGDDIAAGVAAAFLDPNLPATDPDRPPQQNLFDLTVTDATLTTVASTGFQICLSDPGVGILVSGAAIANAHPVAVTAVAATVECTSAAGTSVLLDGSGSGDPDSTPGTNDDIVLFEWFEDFGLASQTTLGSGDVISVPLSMGDHVVTLRVTDGAGLIDTRTITVSVVDTTPPTIGGVATPAVLFPPHHEMIPVGIQVTAGDLCSAVTVSLQQAVSSEPDDAPGAADGETTSDIQGASAGTADFDIDLRAERDATGSGRVYTLTYEARDTAGNQATADVPVPVPLDQGGVVEPVILQVLPSSDTGTVIEWTPVAGAVSYNVVRGLLGNFTSNPNGFDLGDVVWVEYGSADASTAGDEDTENPASPGEVFFYLVEPINGCCPGYSTESAPKPRVVQPPQPV